MGTSNSNGNHSIASTPQVVVAANRKVFNMNNSVIMTNKNRLVFFDLRYYNHCAIIMDDRGTLGSYRQQNNMVYREQ